MGHYLILLLPFAFMPLSGMAIGRYSRTFGVPRFPFSRERLAAALACYLSLALMLAFYEAPGIHATWSFSTLMLFAASLDGNLKMTGQPSFGKRAWIPYSLLALATALWVGLTHPNMIALAAWSAIGTALQAAAIVLLHRGGPKGSPAIALMIVGHGFGMLPTAAAPWVLVYAPWPWVLDLCMVSVTLSALLIAMGGTTMVLEDTARKLRATRDSIAAEVEARTAELREMNRQKDQFLSRVSHELRTPLTSIKGYAEFLQDELEGPLSEGHHAFVRSILDAAQAMGHKVDDLLDLARISAGTLKCEREPFAYDDLLAGVQDMMHPILARKRQTLEVTCPGPLRVVGDRSRLGQVLVNLVTNASKFSPEGATITLHAASSAAGVTTTVADPGIGIPEAHLKQIFEAFYQVDGSNTRVHGGIGMGLAIVRSLVEAHGGHMAVESAPGQGSRFTFFLPARDEPHAAPPAPDGVSLLT